MSYISEKDFKENQQFYYNCLITLINKMNKSSYISDLNFYTLEAHKLIYELNELNQARIHTDGLNTGGI